MAEWKMLRQVISPSDVYANAEAMCDMLREQYGSYDADSLEEVMVDEAFTQRLQERGYDLLGEGGAPADAPPFPPRRDGGRMEGGPSAPMRRPGGDRSMPMRRTPTGDGVPMRRREGPGQGDGGIPLRRSDPRGDNALPRRREGPVQSDGMREMRRRDGAGQGDGVPMRRRDVGTPNVDAPTVERTPRRGWDNAREEAASAGRREHTPLTPPVAPGGDASSLERPSASGRERGRATPRVESPVDVTPPTQDLAPPVVEPPTPPTQSAASAQADAPVAEAPTEEAPAAKPTPRTRRTTRSRTKTDPDASAS